MRPTRAPRRRASTNPIAAPFRSAIQPRPRLDDGPDLGELARMIDVLVCRRRHLGLEGQPERLDGREIVERRAANGHPNTRAPASSM